MTVRGRAVAGRRLRELPALTTRAQAHLLANMLSVVGGFLRRRPEAAEDLLAYLAAHLRSQPPPAAPLVPLSEEIRLVLACTGMERARLGGRLRLIVACAPDALAALVPPLILQPLVENAIRHGIARRPGGGLVRILARTRAGYLHLVVSDDGVGAPRPSPGPPGWGLACARLRLAAIWGARARLRLLSRLGEGTLAAVSLPAVFRQSGRGGRVP